MTSKCKTCGELEEQHLSNKQCVPLSFIGKEGKFQPEDVPDCEKYDKDILGKHTLTKQKKGSSEDVPKEIINHMKDMVRNGKDWKQKKGSSEEKVWKDYLNHVKNKQKGCGKIIREENYENIICGKQYYHRNKELKTYLCPSCLKSLEGKDMSGLEDTSSDNQSLSVKCKDKPEEINQIFGEKLV